jgi:hypothetical protein
MRERETRGGGGAHGEGTGARGARAEARPSGPGWAAPRVKTHRSEFNSRSKIRNETKQHTRLNTTLDKRKYDLA